MNLPLACVIGDLSLVRALGRARIPVAFATCSHDDVTSRSRYVRARVSIPPPEQDPEGVVSALLAWAAAQPLRPVLFYQGDAELLVVSRYRLELARAFQLLLPNAVLVEDAVDKIRFAGLAQRKGLPVPKTLVIEPGLAPDEIESWDRFPAILKPASRVGWFGSDLLAKTVRCNQKALAVSDRDELLQLLPLLLEHSEGFLLQDAVFGGEERVLSYHAYVRKDGEVAAEFTGKKVRTSPRSFGVSSCVEISDDSEVIRLGREILAKVGFRGVVKLDFKRDSRDDRLYLLEMNPRFSLWHHLGAVAGVNVPELVYRDLVTPWSNPAPPRRARPGVRWMAGRRDLRSFREHRAAGELSFGNWLSQWASVEVDEDLSFRDPLPACVDAFAMLRRRIPLPTFHRRHTAPAQGKGGQ